MPKWKRVVYEYGLILGGVALTALALDWFLVPNKIAAGGVSGLATVIYYLWNIPVGVTMLAINIPLLLASVKFLGSRFGLKTVLGAVLLSVLVDVFARYTQPLTSDPLLASIYGGVLSGIGMGFAIKYGGSTGGTDLAALLFSHFTLVSVGQSLLAIDAMVIILAGLVFDPELALYALLALFLTTKVIDVVQEGRAYNKAAYIVSRNPEPIAQAILHDLGRGVTALHGTGMFTRTEREVLFVIVSRHEIAALKEITRKLDPLAFVVISDVHEVLGEGFKGM